MSYHYAQLDCTVDPPFNPLTPISEGFKEAAEKFHAETDIVSDVPLDSLDDRIRIRDAILQGRISSAISMVNDLHPEILDNDRNCFFQLQVFLFNDFYGSPHPSPHPILISLIRHILPSISHYIYTSLSPSLSLSLSNNPYLTISLYPIIPIALSTSIYPITHICHLSATVLH